MARYSVSLVDTQESSLKFAVDRENARISAQNTAILVQWTDQNNFRLDNGLPPLPAPSLISAYTSATFCQQIASVFLAGTTRDREQAVLASVDTRYASMTVSQQKDMLSMMGLSNITPVVG